MMKLLQIFAYLKKIIKFIPIKKNEDREEKLNSIDKEKVIIIFFIIIPIIYFLITKNKSKTLILYSVLFTTYSSYNSYYNKKNSFDYIDSKFQTKMLLIEKKEKEKNYKKNQINRLIVTDNIGREINCIDIKKDSYIIGKKNSKNLVDIDLLKTKNSEMISKIHAEILKFENRWYIIDKNSTNGTVLIKTNNRRILLRSNKEKIQIGDIVEINSNLRILIN